MISLATYACFDREFHIDTAREALESPMLPTFCGALPTCRTVYSELVWPFGLLVNRSGLATHT